MTQAQQSVDNFFSGGGKSVKFPNIGDSVTGIVAAVHPPEQQTTPQGDLVFDKKTGAPRMQIRIELQTDERDPADQFDDGRRTLFCKGWMKGAIGDAMRRAGVTGAPKIGGRLTVKFVEEEPNPGLSATKKYEATYVPPSSSGSADGFFKAEEPHTDGSITFTAPSPAPQKPASMNQAAWDAMDDATKRSVAEALGGLDGPPF